jgi:hypothetical protein
MAVQRRVNWISQQRVDTPDMRAVESAASNDFDQLIQSFVTGTSQGYVLRGFEISMSGAIGGAASGLQLLVDPGAIFHVTSAQSGTFLLVPSGTTAQQLNSATNTIVDGAFAPSAINYVGIEYERFIDDTTSSQVYVWNPTTNNETTKNAPRASVLRFRVKITTSTFAANVLPIATVTTDAGNNVVTISDARWNLTRLGRGGASPDPFYKYPWTAHSQGRTESASSSSSNSINPFRGGDKMLGNLKEWMDAMMTSIQEIKGTTYWYSPSSSGSLESLRQDLGNTVITGRGKISHSKTTAGLINWDEDIQVRVVGSKLAYTLLANGSSTDITLTDEKVAYVTLVRGVTAVPNLIFTNGSAVVTSVGAVAWTSLLQAGDWLKVGAETDAFYYEIQSVDSLTQVTLTENFAETSTGAAGAKGKYAFGSYQSSPTPSTSRHIFIANREDVPAGEDVFWLFLRSDNSGGTPRVYIRFMGSEIEQGEDRQVSDQIALEVLQYIGSPIESADEPQYVEATDPGSLPEITDLLFGAASTISSNQFFLINSSADARSYYVWFNKDGAGTDPEVPGLDAGVEVAITTGQTAAQVAAAVAAALSATDADDFDAIQRAIPNTDQVRVTNNSAGTCVNASNFNVGAPFSITIIQNGTGSGNKVVQDGDNLTLAIKKLDDAYGAIIDVLDDPTYNEVVDIVTAGATPPTSLNGPIAANTIINLPNNTRVGNAVQKYTVGQGVLEVRLNGQALLLGRDWDEVGVAQSASNQIEILIGLVVGDALEFRAMGFGSGSGGGGGGVGPQGPAGIAGPAGSDAAGGPVAISTKTGNYTVLLSDNVLLGNCTAGAIIFSLPPAASAVGNMFYFKKIDSSANPLTLQANGSELIDGFNTQSTLVQYESFTLVTDGSAWYIL